MLTTALVVFAAAAVGGLILALHILRQKFPPWALSIVHAVLGAVGLVLLLVAVLDGTTSPIAMWALVLFAVAALGGFFLASFHYRQQLPHKAIVVIHAGVAVVAFGLLLSVLLVA